MARRRRRDDDWVKPVAGLAGLATLAFVFIPGFRQLTLAIGFIALVVLVLLILGFVLFGIYRRATAERGVQSTTGGVFALPAFVPAEKSEEVEPEPKWTPETSSTTEFIEQLHSMDWFQFEKLVGYVYQKYGYAVTHRGGANPDGGIDLIIEKDSQRTAVQCKQWKTWNVGVRAIREFMGALTDSGVPKGIFVTLRGYTEDAKALAAKHGIEILNETGLTQMLESTDARFDPEVLELLHDTRKFCPKCGRELVIRIAGRGPNSGGKFWGCSGFSRCRFTMLID